VITRGGERYRPLEEIAGIPVRLVSCSRVRYIAGTAR